MLSINGYVEKIWHSLNMTHSYTDGFKFKQRRQRLEMKNNKKNKLNNINTTESKKRKDHKIRLILKKENLKQLTTRVPITGFYRSSFSNSRLGVTSSTIASFFFFVRFHFNFCKICLFWSFFFRCWILMSCFFMIKKNIIIININELKIGAGFTWILLSTAFARSLFFFRCFDKIIFGPINDPEKKGEKVKR